MDSEKIINKILSWSSEKTSSGKSFDDLFTVEGISLGWYCKKLFLPGVIPQQLDVYRSIEKDQELTNLQKTRFSLTAKVLKKALYLNEKKKLKASLKKSIYSEEKKVLFLSYISHISNDGNIFRIQEVIDEFKRNGKLNGKIIYTAPLSSRFSQELANLPNVYQYYDQEIAAKAEETSSKLFEQWKKLDKKIKEELVILERKSLWPNMQYLFEFYFSKEFLTILATHFYIAKKVLEQEKIAVIILTSPNSLFERCFVAAAKLRSTPCIVIQHGLGLGRLIDFSCPVHYALFGKENKNKVIAAGAPPEYVHVTGPVVFDQAYQYKNKAKDNKNQSNELLVVTGPYVEDNNLPKRLYFQRMNEILKKISSLKDHKIIIKLHPREKYKVEYEKIVKNNDIQNVTFFDNTAPREKFYEAIAKCKSFVSFGSTASIEAMIIGKPIVTINPTDTFEIVSLLEDSTINVYYHEDIKAAIERSFLDEDHFKKKREKYLQNYCGLVDGKASERIVQLALQLSKTNS